MPPGNIFRSTDTLFQDLRIAASPRQSFVAVVSVRTMLDAMFGDGRIDERQRLRRAFDYVQMTGTLYAANALS